ncbi:hypothetical protein DS832_07640 [Bombilactobacillus bombi]|uniref:Uncharacterized protein n=1 Tax=Bombilactobacillus bombi TaxID=1303590 RepID=A0A3R7CKA2_9LACO|nr:hypothetical protein [Bombilactobacillus bombi]RHW45442.1 hypothetical protein DS832_07640 [Bombilactobacillus bombi]
MSENKDDIQQDKEEQVKNTKLSENETISKVASKIHKVPSQTLIGVALVVLVLVAGTYFYLNRKTSILTGDAANVKFSGYDGSGSAIYDTTTANLNIFHTLAKKVGLDESVANKLLESIDTSSGNSNDLYSSDAYTSDQRDKIIKMVQWAKETKVDIEPTSHLSNGDKVKVTVDTSNNKNNPIKAETKTFKVKGLKSVKTKSTNSLLSSIKADFVGFDGYGAVVLSSNKIKSNTTFTVKRNGSLSNGQTVTVKAPESLFQEDGVKYVGKRTVKFKVRGLSEFTKISNVDEVKKVTDSVVKDSYDDDHYTVTFINLYAFPNSTKTKDDSSYDSSNSAEITSQVEVNDHTAKKILNKRVKVIALYQCQYVDQEEDNKPEYVEVTISNLKDQNNVLNIDKINTDDDASHTSVNKSLTTIQHNLAADGIKLK